MRYLLILPLLFITTVGYACESYEECIKNAQNTDISGSISDGEVLANIQMASLAYQRAIALKLDEISRKLDHKESEYISTGGPFLMKKKSNE